MKAGLIFKDKSCLN